MRAIGRGNNKKSRANLRTPVRKWYVYGRGAGIGWSQLFGPCFQKEATEMAAKLETLNHTQMKPMYVASTEQN